MSDVPNTADVDEILTADALAFIFDLHRRFNGERIALVRGRLDRQKEIDAGVLPDFPTATADVRAADGARKPR